MQVNEQQNIQASARLCDAIKWHPCLYDSKSKVYQMKHAVDAAWRSIANECEDTVANCKFRWRVIRKSFAIAYRKHGAKNKHYLKEYLQYLVPHVNSIDINERVSGAERVETMQHEEEAEESEGDEAEEYEEDHIEDDAEEFEHIEEEENEEEYEEREYRPKVDQHTDEQESETSSAEETVKDKFTGRASRNRANASKLDDTHDEDGDSQQGRRISRTRKATKRYLESGLCDSRKKERQDEKRPRISFESNNKKSHSSSPALQEPEKRKTPMTANLPNKRVEVKLVKTKINEPEPKPVEPKKPTPEAAGKFKVTSTDKSRTVMIKVSKPTENTDSTVVKRYTISAPAEIKKCANQSTQCDNDKPNTLDEEFLDSIKPQMELMNSRQKFNFKKRVFQALMDVFDDATNFPNKGEVIDLPATGAPRYENTTLGELRLIRELVHLVQAAKTTPEIMEANEKVELPIESSVTSSPSDKGDKSDKNQGNIVVAAERKSTTTVQVLKNKETLGLPRHILQKVVKVAGSNGGTILAHEGEKRRVYRIYPKGTLPPSVASATNSNVASTAIGTFYVTPPKTTTAALNPQSKTVAVPPTATLGTVNGKPITFNGKFVSHVKTSSSSSQPMAVATANPVIGRPRLSARPTAADMMIERRRSSQGSTGPNIGPIPALQNKNVTSTNAQKLTPPALTRAPKPQQQQVVNWDDNDKPAPSTGLAQIQISQPISLNAAASSSSSVKTFLESAGENEGPGDNSPNTILPDGGMVDEEDTGNLITGDGYDPLFIKSLIKDEPSE
uniref:MADF domain-containing protein n=1 Tax=Stomoxys calcitrans TaxID=35570 RepID=A0A1I8Q3C6_STOCA